MVGAVITTTTLIYKEIPVSTVTTGTNVLCSGCITTHDGMIGFRQEVRFAACPLFGHCCLLPTCTPQWIKEHERTRLGESETVTQLKPIPLQRATPLDDRHIPATPSEWRPDTGAIRVRTTESFLPEGGAEITSPASREHELKKREADAEIIVDFAGHTLTASQYPTVTTGWWESIRPDGVHTWVSIVFTQTFATTVLDQLGSAQSGTISAGKNSADNETWINRFAVESGYVVNGTIVVESSAVNGFRGSSRSSSMIAKFVFMNVLMAGLVVLGDI